MACIGELSRAIHGLLRSSSLFVSASEYGIFTIQNVHFVLQERKRKYKENFDFQKFSLKCVLVLVFGSPNGDPLPNLRKIIAVKFERSLLSSF